MAVNVTVRDIVNYPGGTAKTVTVDILQIVPKGPAEGDEKWITSHVTTATASGGGSIQSIFKNEMLRGFIKSSGLKNSPYTFPVNPQFDIAVDEAITNAVTITLSSGGGGPIVGADVAQDIEDKIRATAEIGQGGAKVGNLSYLNTQVRFSNNKFSIESGTVSDSFTGGSAPSTVAIRSTTGGGNDILPLLGLDTPLSSETFAARQFVVTELEQPYTAGSTIDVGSTSGFAAGDCFLLVSGTTTENAIVESVPGGTQLAFTTFSGGDPLQNTYPAGTLVKKLYEVDAVEPISATNTVDQIIRFGIDSIVNQIDFNA